MSHGDYKDFFRAACDGDLELVRHHLLGGIDVDFIHPELMSTALVAAIEGGAPLEAAEAAGLDDVAAWLRADPGEMS